jgi:hypothetical protein
MSEYAIILPATTSYLSEAKVLLKSLVNHMADIPVHIISKDNEAEELNQFNNVVNIYNEPECDSEFRRIRTSRFRYAAEISNEYKSVCLLDADMLCVRDFSNIFRMADTGMILVGSNNTLLRYRKKDFDKMAVEVPEVPEVNIVHPTFTTVPTFVNPKIHEDWLRAIWENKTGNDLDVPNLLSASLGKTNNLYYLPSYSWTNIHHTMLKPETFVRYMDGYYSHQGEPIYMFHGHWLDDKYKKQLVEPMQKNYGYYPKYVECARNCIKLIESEYEQYK